MQFAVALLDIMLYIQSTMGGTMGIVHLCVESELIVTMLLAYLVCSKEAKMCMHNLFCVSWIPYSGSSQLI